MDSKIILKLRQALGLSKKYTDEKVAETKQYVDQKFAALPVPPEVPNVPLEDIAAQVVAMLPKPKKLKAKKKQIKINTVSPEDVMAMITSVLKDVKTEYKNTGDTIIIQEAPQRVVEHIKEVIREKGGEVDYDLIYMELEKQIWRMRETMVVGSSNSIRGLIDADLTGVPQNERGVYMLGELGGASQDVFGITVDGASNPLTTGSKGFRYIGQDCIITGWDLRSDIVGDVVFDLHVNGVSITGTEKPTLSGQSEAQDLALSTWSVNLTAGDVVEFIIDSTATLTRVTLTVVTNT